MPLEVKHKLTQEQLKFGLMLHNHLLFTKFFWREELTIPDDREDLPKGWRELPVKSVKVE